MTDAPSPPADEAAYWLRLRPRRRPDGPEATALDCLQSHPRWPELRDPNGRTAAMWTMVYHPELWRGLRKSELRSMIQATNANGQSLWFYALLHTLPINARQRGGLFRASMARRRKNQCPENQPEDLFHQELAGEFTDWLKKHVPDVRQDGEGLLPALFSDAGTREIRAVCGAQDSYPALFAPSWFAALGQRFPLESFWLASAEVERQAAVAVWNGVFLDLVRKSGARAVYYDGPLGDDPAGANLAIVAAISCGRAAETLLSHSKRVRQTAAAMSPVWRTAVGAAVQLAATSASNDTIQRARALTDVLWERTEAPAPWWPLVKPEPAWVEHLKACVHASRLRDMVIPSTERKTRRARL